MSNRMLRKREILSELEGLDGSMMSIVPYDSRRYWEGYRNAMCRVIGVDKVDYPFAWEA